MGEVVDCVYEGVEVQARYAEIRESARDRVFGGG